SSSSPYSAASRITSSTVTSNSGSVVLTSDSATRTSSIVPSTPGSGRAVIRTGVPYSITTGPLEDTGSSSGPMTSRVAVTVTDDPTSSTSALAVHMAPT